MAPRILFSVLFWALSLLAPAFAEEPSPELRSIIGSASGHAFLSPGASEEEGWKKAFDAALRAVQKNITQALQERISGSHAGLSFEVSEYAPGQSIIPLKKEKVGIQEQGTTRDFSVRITAEVRYRLKTDLPVETLLTDAKLPLTVRIWTDKKQYREGEKITFFLQGNRDFFARLFDVAVDGTTIQLLPNRFRDFQYFRGGQTYRVPDKQAGDTFDFHVEPPLGKEHVMVYASEAPLGNLLFREYIGGLFGKVEGSSDQLASTLKDIAPNQTLSAAQKEQGAFRFVEFIENHWSLETGR